AQDRAPADEGETPIRPEATTNVDERRRRVGEEHYPKPRESGVECSWLERVSGGIVSPRQASRSSQLQRRQGNTFVDGHSCAPSSPVCGLDSPYARLAGKLSQRARRLRP